MFVIVVQNGLKHVGVLLPFRFIFYVEYTIIKDREIQKGLEFYEANK
jgi:hypothetical protein